MAAIPYAKPSPFSDGGPMAFPIFDNGIATVGQTILEGDFLVMTGAGTVSRAASNTATRILGLANHNGADIYYAGPGGSAAAKNHLSNFGASIAGTQLMSTDPLTINWSKLGNGIWAEMSLVQAYAQSSVGAAVGITLDPVTNLFVADTTATACAVIVRLVEGVFNAQYQGTGGIGDTGCRVLVRFQFSALEH